MEPAKIVQLVGHHYRNPRDPNEFAADGGEAYLRKTLLRNLKMGEVDLPPTLEEQKAGIPSKKVTMNELGISYPVLLYVPNVVEESIPNPGLFPLPPGIVPPLDAGRSGASSSSSTQRGAQASPPGAFEQYARQRGMQPYLTVRRFDFVIQFAWQETPPSQRRIKAEGGGESVSAND
jgi:hypothetical protein